MGIIAGQTIVASDFVGTPSGAGDSGKVAKLASDGKIPTGFLRFGGDGSDGALAITSGTTTINLGGAAVFVKNYTSISITGTGKLAFSNPHANGTIIIFKSQGNVTITSSGTPAIDLRSLGASSGNAATGLLMRAPKGGNGSLSAGGTGTVAPFASAITSVITRAIYNLLTVGSSGGNGQAKSSSTHGGGGQGGNNSVNTGSDGNRNASANASGSDTGSSSGAMGAGGMLIECAGAYSCSGTINGSGDAAANITSTGNGGNGGGGGGAAGFFIALYNFLTSDTGTYTMTGGAGGTTVGGDDGGAGATGFSLRAKNTEFC